MAQCITKFVCSQFDCVCVFFSLAWSSTRNFSATLGETQRTITIARPQSILCPTKKKSNELYALSTSANRITVVINLIMKSKLAYNHMGCAAHTLFGYITTPGFEQKRAHTHTHINSRSVFVLIHQHVTINQVKLVWYMRTVLVVCFATWRNASRCFLLFAFCSLAAGPSKSRAWV